MLRFDVKETYYLSHLLLKHYHYIYFQLLERVLVVSVANLTWCDSFRCVRQNQDLGHGEQGAYFEEWISANRRSHQGHSMECGQPTDGSCWRGQREVSRNLLFYKFQFSFACSVCHLVIKFASCNFTYICFYRSKIFMPLQFPWQRYHYYDMYDLIVHPDTAPDLWTS